MRIALLVLRWKIKARYFLRDFAEVRKHPIVIWRRAAKWEWFAVLCLGAIGFMAIGEYGFGVFLLFLSALSVASKIQHWPGISSKLLSRVLQITGISTVVVVFVICIFTAVVMKGDAPWSHLPQGWNKMITVLNPVVAPTIDWEAVSRLSRLPSYAVTMIPHPLVVLAEPPHPVSPPPEEISPYLIYGSKRIEIHNGGSQNIWLWGFAYGDGPVSTEKESTLIAPGTFYFLPTDDLESKLLATLKNGGGTFLSCRVFVIVYISEKKTIRCSLGVSKNSGALTINTRIIDIVDGWKTEQQAP